MAANTARQYNRLKLDNITDAEKKNEISVWWHDPVMKILTKVNRFLWNYFACRLHSCSQWISRLEDRSVITFESRLRSYQPGFAPSEFWHMKVDNKTYFATRFFNLCSMKLVLSHRHLSRCSAYLSQWPLLLFSKSCNKAKSTLSSPHSTDFFFRGFFFLSFVCLHFQYLHKTP